MPVKPFCVEVATQNWKMTHLQAQKILDNHALWNHRAMAAILGVILKLLPIKQIMASEQIKSRYFGI